MPGTHHIAFTVKSIADTASFWKKCYGFIVEKEFQIPEMSLNACIIRRDDIRFELFESKHTQDLPSHSNNLDTDLCVQGIKHFAFQVDDIAKEYERLKALGVDFSSPPKKGKSGHNIAFFKDPNGILFELFET